MDPWATKSSPLDPTKVSLMAAKSDRHDPLITQMWSSPDFAPALRPTPSHAVDLLSSVQQHSMDLQEEQPKTIDHALRLQSTFSQLNAHSGEDAQRASFSTAPVGMSCSQNGAAIGLQELVARELKAHGKTVEPGRKDLLSVDHLACQLSSRVSAVKESLKPHDALDSSSDSCVTTPPHGADEPPVRPALAYLYREMDNKDAALRQAKQEIRKLRGERDASVANLERHVASLESLLKSVMLENDDLKEALSAALANKPAKYSQRVMPEAVERSMISNLIQSGIPHIPSTPISNGSASTETPPLEADADASSLEGSRESVQTILM